MSYKNNYLFANVKDYGAVGNGVTDDSTAINSAITALGALGGVVFFPPGTYILSSPITISAQLNVRLVGTGSRYYQDFAHPLSSILYTGTGSTPALTITTNYARNFQMEQMDMSYSSSSFTGSLIYIDDTAGITFTHSSFGGNGAGSGFLTSAEAVIKAAATEKIHLQNCEIQQAQRGVWLPSLGQECGVLTIRDCQIGNIVIADVQVDPGALVNAIIEDNLFDATSVLNSQYGLVLTATGFTVRGNAFSASNANVAPNTMYVVLSGYGEFTGNTIATSWPGLQVMNSGIYHISGNYVQGNPPFTISGGMVHGGGNTWAPTAISGSSQVNGTLGISVNTDGYATALDLGPDAFIALYGAPFDGYSVLVNTSGGSTVTTGNIKYNSLFDSSSQGLYNSGLNTVSFQNQIFQSFTQRNCPVNGAVGSAGFMGQCTIPAHSLDQQGKGVKFRAWGTTNNASHIIELQVELGITLLYNSGNVVSDGYAWELNGSIYRTTSASTQACFVAGNFQGSAIIPTYTNASVDLTVDNNLYILGGGAAAATDIILYGFDVEIIQ